MSSEQDIPANVPTEQDRVLKEDTSELSSSTSKHPKTEDGDKEEGVINGTEQTLSKRALKRKLKHEKWLKWRPIKRAKEKEKMKLKKQYARDHNIPLGPSRKALKSVKMGNSSNKLRVCIDFSFDHLMTQKDTCKCVKQFNRCYSLNRRAQHPLQFYVSSFKDKCRQEIERYNGYQNWDVHIHEEPYLDIFNKEDLVYLTSDSNNIIQDLDTSKVYIIGGLVDHNQHKLLTLNKAQSEGIAHGKLPIDTYLSMKTRQVLAVNHVFEILLAISSEQKSWKDALLQTLPERKNAAAKSVDESDSEEKNKPSGNEVEKENKCEETEYNEGNTEDKKSEDES
uniref:tRNA (guanine(9)-N(1))-methyltransferase n=1 Tax=Cacopsylla melanoneura TaxID=428564 RepID=A0A8D8RZB9_9HEMI